MKSLVIAEKPSVARDIARVLHCTQKGNGTLEGKEYVVTWALGHLVTLADPEEYDKKYTKWEMSALPMLPDKMKLVVIRQTGKQYNASKPSFIVKISKTLLLPQMPAERENWWQDGFWIRRIVINLFADCGYLLLLIRPLKKDLQI